MKVRVRVAEDLVVDPAECGVGAASGLDGFAEQGQLEQEGCMFGAGQVGELIDVTTVTAS